jgi:hypothetical protein
MPDHLLLVARLLAEIMGHGADEMGTDQIFDIVQEPGLLQQPIDPAAMTMPAIDRVAVVARRLGRGHELIEVAAVRLGFFRREDIEGKEVAFLVELPDLRLRQLPEVRVFHREEPELPLHLRDRVRHSHQCHSPWAPHIRRCALRRTSSSPAIDLAQQRRFPCRRRGSEVGLRLWIAVQQQILGAGPECGPSGPHAVG